MLTHVRNTADGGHMHHVTARAKIIIDNTGIQAEIPIILTERGPLEPLVAYCIEHIHPRSFSWMQKLLQAVGLLLDYMTANHACFENPKELFRTFANRLTTGTIGEDGLDPSGLYWLPMTSTIANQLINLISAFSDWMSQRGGTMQLNPWRQATSYEEKLNWAAYLHRNDRAFLGHTWSREAASETAKKARNTLLKRSPKIEHEGVKYFPENRFADLITKGFIVPGKQESPRVIDRVNLRDVLITLLQHGGAVRKCEPFHLYVHDVVPDPREPNSALVRIYHPSDGLAPNDWLNASGIPVKCNREAYLRGKYQMRPRNTYPKTDSFHAGWKDPTLDSSAGFFHVHWFPTWMGKLFKQLWDRYLIQRALMNCRHPFAFVALSGRPYAIGDYNEAYERAIRRIGLVPAKMNGTTPHAHRHAYGRRMKKGGVEAFERKRALHHKSLESQLIYTEPTIEDITSTMKAASQRLEQPSQEFLSTNFLEYGFEDIDPLGLFSGTNPRLRNS